MKLTEIAKGSYSKNKKLISESHGRMYGIVYPKSIGAFGSNAAAGYKPRQMDDNNAEFVQDTVSNKSVYAERIRDKETRKQIKKYLKSTIKEAENKIKEAKKALEQINQIAD